MSESNKTQSRMTLPSAIAAVIAMLYLDTMPETRDPDEALHGMSINSIIMNFVTDAGIDPVTMFKVLRFIENIGIARVDHEAMRIYFVEPSSDLTRRIMDEVKAHGAFKDSERQVREFVAKRRAEKAMATGAGPN
ncbi:hypothetical protein UFOVP141_41 [uncultured Caudovirales phage]|uniref:Uncharacterized protein n=1 Tax=uncultured Caudovirales phage TaxID=2100421 RepID=A0A6J7VL91_9CAUD|nr:hypothetical protein UFOVP141_41 [uncultured Caudovirales phage]